jgi:hypothetical protein
MGWQTVATALLVLACSGYALWTLMPAALRARLRPGRPAAWACGGCGGCGPAAPAQAQRPIHIVRRPPSA